MILSTMKQPEGLQLHYYFSSFHNLLDFLKVQAASLPQSGVSAALCPHEQTWARDDQPWKPSRRLLGDGNRKCCIQNQDPSEAIKKTSQLHFKLYVPVSEWAQSSDSAQPRRDKNGLHWLPYLCLYSILLLWLIICRSPREENAFSSNGGRGGKLPASPSIGGEGDRGSGKGGKGRKPPPPPIFPTTVFSQKLSCN